jgi:hypothetical protein
MDNQRTLAPASAAYDECVLQNLMRETPSACHRACMDISTTAMTATGLAMLPPVQKLVSLLIRGIKIPAKGGTAATGVNGCKCAESLRRQI